MCHALLYIIYATVYVICHVTPRHVTQCSVRFGSVRLCHVCARFMTFNVIKREIIEVYTSQMMKN